MEYKQSIISVSPVSTESPKKETVIDIIREIVKRTAEAFGKPINFIADNWLIVAQELDKLEATHKGRITKYPAILLFTDNIQENPAPPLKQWDWEVNLERILICTNAIQGNGDEKRATVYSDILNPICENFLTAINQHTRIFTKGIHAVNPIVYNRYNLTVSAGKTKIFADNLDGIEIRNLKLKIRDKCIPKPITPPEPPLPPEKYTLNIQKNGNGIVVPTPGKYEFEQDTVVFISALGITADNEDDNTVFDKWTGDITSTDNQLSVIMTKNTNITANFTGAEPPEPPIDDTFFPITVTFLYRDMVTGQEVEHKKRYNVGDNAVFPEIGDIPEIRDPNDNLVYPALTFQGWNFEQSELNNLQHDICVGAHYVTTDGWTKLYVVITPTTGTDPIDALTQTIRFQLQPPVLNRVLTIKWGDGISEEITSASTNILLAIEHKYKDYGNYWIELKLTSGTATYHLNGTTSVPIFSTTSKQSILVRCFFGENIIDLNYYLFYYSTNLEEYTFPIISGTILFAQSMRWCYRLKNAVIPKGATHIDSFNFSEAYCLKNISLPMTVKYIPQGTNASAFNLCTSLKNFVIGKNVEIIGTSTFASCYNLQKYIILPLSPPTLTNINAFSGINRLCKMYVPDESLELYKTATNWLNFKDHMYPLSQLYN